METAQTAVKKEKKTAPKFMSGVLMRARKGVSRTPIQGKIRQSHASWVSICVPTSRFAV
jgi:hypothetical protein